MQIPLVISFRGVIKQIRRVSADFTINGSAMQYKLTDRMEN